MEFKMFLFCALLLKFLCLPIISEAYTTPQEEAVLSKSLSLLTLEEAVSLALQHSPLIKQAKLIVALAELDVKNTNWWRALMPSLNITSGYDPLFGDSRLRAILTFDLKGVLDEINDSKRAKLKLIDAELYLKNTESRVIETVTKSFLDYRTALERVPVYEDKIVQDVKLRELAKVNFEVGEAKLDEILKHNHLLNEDRLILLEAKAELVLKELKLKHDIGEQ